MSVDGLDPDGVVVLEPTGDSAVGGVEVFGVQGEFAVRVKVVTETRRDFAPAVPQIDDPHLQQESHIFSTATNRALHPVDVEVIATIIASALVERHT